MRDGWLHLETKKAGKHQRLDIFDKQINHGWTLRKLSHAEISRAPGKGCYWDEHVLLYPKSNQTIPCPDWELADLDGKRIVWATGGRLETGRLTADGVVDQRLLHNFNDMQFAAIKAPY